MLLVFIYFSPFTWITISSKEISTFHTHTFATFLVVIQIGPVNQKADFTKQMENFVSKCLEIKEAGLSPRIYYLLEPLSSLLVVLKAKGTLYEIQLKCFALIKFKYAFLGDCRSLLIVFKLSVEGIRDLQNLFLEIVAITCMHINCSSCTPLQMRQAWTFSMRYNIV